MQEHKDDTDSVLVLQAPARKMDLIATKPRIDVLTRMYSVQGMKLSTAILESDGGWRK